MRRWCFIVKMKKIRIKKKQNFKASPPQKGFKDRKKVLLSTDSIPPPAENVNPIFLSLLCGCTANQSASVGIIGGADGPTAVFVTGTLGSWVIPLLVIILLVLAAIFLYRRRKH